MVKRILGVGLSTYKWQTGSFPPDPSVSSVTYNGISLNKLRYDQHNWDESGWSYRKFRTEIWYLLNPPSGTYPIVADFSADVITMSGAIDYSGVDQSTPWNTDGGEQGTDPLTLALTTTFDDCVIVTQYCGYYGIPDHFELWQLGSDLVGGCGEKVCDSIGTYSVSWDGFDTHQTMSVGALSPAPPELSTKVSGGLDYSEKENVKIRLAALVKDATTREAVSIADVTIKIYYPDGTLWVSDKMVESLSGSGIYEWESSKTIVEMKLEDGVYLVHIKASVRNGPVASDMLLFHIDPPYEATSLTPLLYYATAVVILAVGTTIGIVLLRRHRRSQISQ